MERPYDILIIIALSVILIQFRNFVEQSMLIRYYTFVTGVTTLVNNILATLYMYLVRTAVDPIPFKIQVSELYLLSLIAQGPGS
jgi:hypothetical protein